jgi:hypothetical protein
LQEELASLQASKQQEESAFRSRVEERWAELDAELAGLVKKSVLGGFLSCAIGDEHLPLNKGERICWCSPIGKLKQRSAQGQSYWDLDGDGTLFVTTDRIVFATPDGKRWQRPLAKMHTVLIENMGSRRDVPALVLAFDGLQKPVAFYFGVVTFPAVINGYQCSADMTVADLAEMLQSRFRTM